MPLISDTDAWKNLNELRDQMLGVPLADLFDAVPELEGKLG